MSNDLVFIDANVLLETILSKRKNAFKAQQYIKLHNVTISPLTAHLLAYFGQKDGLPLDFLLKILGKHSFTDFGVSEITWAVKNRQNNDFEDALQVACAVTSGADKFVTFDKKLAQAYKAFINTEWL